MVAKAGLGLIGLSAISVGGVALAKPHLLGMDYMPKWHSLSEDSTHASEYNGGTNKFGKKYGKYLVSVNNKENQSWWEWAYRRLKASTPSENGKFSLKGTPKVTDAYSTDSNKTTVLNQVCKDAFSKEDSNGFGTDNDKFSKDEVWKYCSPGKLITTSEDTGNDAYGDNTIGGASDNKSKLVSVKDNSNDWFWEIRNKDFWSQEDSNDWSGQKSTDSSLFKTTYDADKNKEEKSRKTIKKICQEVYGTNKVTSGTDNNNDDAKKFCVLEASVD